MKRNLNSILKSRQAVAQPECVHGPSWKGPTDRSAITNANNEICLWVQIGDHVNISKSARQTDRFILLLGEEDYVQGGLCDNKFLIQK